MRGDGTVRGDAEGRGPRGSVPHFLGTPGLCAAAPAAPSWEGEVPVGWLCFGFGTSEVWGEPRVVPRKGAWLAAT